MEQSHGNALVRLTATFEGQPITTIERDNAPLFISHQIAAPLGYTDPARLASKITSEWGLVENRHYLKLTGEDLAPLKAALGPDIIDPRAPSLVLLTEVGLYRALMRSRAPRAEAFQEWLAADVLPQLRQTGTYQLAAADPSAISTASTTIRFELLRELRAGDEISAPSYAARLGEMVKSGLSGALLGPIVDELVTLAVPAAGRSIPAIAQTPQEAPPDEALPCWTALARAWHAAIGTRPVTLAELRDFSRSPSHPALAKALAQCAEDQHTLGNRLRYLNGRTFGGFRFQASKKLVHGTRTWFVVGGVG